MFLYILPEVSDTGNFLPNIEKRGTKTQQACFRHWNFQPLFNDIIILQTPYISRENAILSIKTQNRILKFQTILYQAPPDNDLIP